MSRTFEQRILDEAPVWEEDFDGGPGMVVSVKDAATVARRQSLQDQVELLESIVKGHERHIGCGGTCKWRLGVKLSALKSQLSEMEGAGNE